MLSYQNRLILAKDIESVYRTGRAASGGTVFLKAKKNNLDISRFAFSVGIKFSAKAVQRNKSKRQLRELTRKNIERIEKGYDILVGVKKSSDAGLDIKELEKSFLAALKKGNLIR